MMGWSLKKVTGKLVSEIISNKKSISIECFLILKENLDIKLHYKLLAISIEW